MGYTTICACGAVLNEGDVFCCNCGKPVQKALGPASGAGKRCTCGAPLENGDVFCPNCGRKQEKASAPPPGKTCGHCGTKLEEDDMFCPNCGKKQEEQIVFVDSAKKCIHCGAVIEDGDLFCPECGKPQQTVKEPEKPVQLVQEKKGRVCTCGMELQESDVFCPNCGERMEPSAGAMKGLDIFKLAPKTNCRACGCPTCMSFCMKVAQGAASIDECPHFSDDAKITLGFPVVKKAAEEKQIVVSEVKAEQTVQEKKPIIPEVKIPEIKKPVEDPMAKFRRRRVCPDCKLMFAADKEACPICGSPLVDKK